MRHPHRSGGFTVLELMITVTVAGLLLSFAVPGLTKWVNNNKIRSVADQLQNGIRLAQNEALRRSHQVVFALASDASLSAESTAGAYWVVKTIPFLESEASERVDSGSLTGTNARVAITGSVAQICFNAVGRLVTNTATGISGTGCSTGTAQYNVSLTGAGSDTPLRVTVGLNGQVHLYNPNKTLSDTSPDGC